MSVQREAEWKASLELDGVVSTICLKRLDLSGNLFSFALFGSIVDVLADIPMTRLNLSDNQPMEEKQVNEIRKMVPHLDIQVTSQVKKRKKKQTKDASKETSLRSSGSPRTPKTSSSYRVTSSSRRTTPSQRKSSSASQIFKEQEEKVKPKRARNRIQSHPEVSSSPHFVWSEETRHYNTSESGTSSVSSQEVELAPGVVIAGRRANEFIDFVQELCSVATSIVERQARKRARRATASRLRNV